MQGAQTDCKDPLEQKVLKGQKELKGHLGFQERGETPDTGDLKEEWVSLGRLDLRVPR